MKDVLIINSYIDFFLKRCIMGVAKECGEYSIQRNENPGVC